MVHPPVEPYVSADFDAEEFGERRRAVRAAMRERGLDALLVVGPENVLLGDPMRAGDGGLAAPTGPGLGVELDPEKVRRYADLYAREGASYAFTDDAGHTPLLPKM